MMSFLPNELFNHEYAQLCFLNFKLGNLVEATALPSLSGKDVGEILIAKPTLKEQIAIAQIFSDMDTKELTALNQRLAKLNDIKQGLMQNLLTGKIRLTE